MATLHLNLHRKWFDKIYQGLKVEEYREITPYWSKRFQDWRNKYNTVTFSNGYSKNRDQFEVELFNIKKDIGLPNWGAEEGKLYFVLSLGNLIKKNF